MFGYGNLVLQVQWANVTTYLKTYKECDSFHRIIASVHIVSHEQVVCVGWLPSNSEELHEVMKLAMDVATYCDWASYLLDIRFLGQYLFCLKKINKKQTGL